MSILYVQATNHFRWLIESAETALQVTTDGAVIDQSFFRGLKTDHYPTDEEIRLVIDALAELDVIRRDGSSYRLSRAALLETNGYRQGIRDAVRVLPAQDENLAKLCATLPLALNSMVEKALRAHTADLRATLLDLIASSENRIILASPFWDLQTTKEMVEPLRRRLTAGVTVDLLGRFSGDGEQSRGLLQNTLGSYEKCQLFAWYERGNHGSSRLTTFHFKAAVVDNASRAYLGTANFTESSLRSVMELGVILTGKPATQLLGILNVILSISTPLK